MSAVIAMSTCIVAGGYVPAVEPVIEPVVVAPVPVVVEEDKDKLYAGLALAYSQTYSTDYKYFDNALTQDQNTKFVGLLGYNFNEYIGVEGRIGTSIFGTNTSILVEDYAEVMTYSIFLRPQYSVNEDFTLYGLLGFGLVQVDGADGEAPADPSIVGEEILNDTVFQWGFGLAYKIDEEFSIFIDYTKLANDADISSTLYGYDSETYEELSSQDLTVGIHYTF